ncbi:NAD(P)-dependent oxidoreductase [Microvirga sp. VF16]|uniref:NAD-dependent epimerase/dehydratase family protein n=1 Tax=Microvirga sp. VF16 TaxID=2807101 RepID=UPI00193CBB8F|nr:NAD(P)-dependent oxidoreductase [Microvirga sp. VF16]QRM29396.1 NAD(P)-dependent oxidoreductase [Microvirga sp. VF16]
MTSKRILLTGAAGLLGDVLRRSFAGQFQLLRLSDIVSLGTAGKGEEIVACDLADAAAVEAMCQGVDAIIHLGGIPYETGWPELLRSNIIGTINLYEGARRAGVDRVIFASSNHATGMHPNDRMLSGESPARPDSRYGLTKAFGEDVAALYAYKHGIRSFCLRIGSCLPKPDDKRALSTWLSQDDFVRLIQVGLSADYVHEIVYGVSKNTRSWWDNSAAYRLGYEPQDNAEVYAADVGDIELKTELARQYQGGNFVADEFEGRKEWLG